MSTSIRPVGVVVQQDAMRCRSLVLFARLNGEPYGLCKQQARWPTNSVGGAACKTIDACSFPYLNPALQHSVGWLQYGDEAFGWRQPAARQSRRNVVR
jgi:hypothetical protein